MYRNIGLLFAMAALAVISTAAAARDGCGRGLYYNGYRCVPERGYDGPRQDRGPPALFDFGGGNDSQYRRPVPGPRGQLACQQRGYTIQDGFCKPYRGY